MLGLVKVHKVADKKIQPSIVVVVEKAGIGGFISEAPDGGQSHIDRGGREVLLFEKEPVPEDDRPVKCKAGFGTVPPDKFVDGVTV